MSNAGRQNSLNNLTLIFDDGASEVLPQIHNVPSGRYQPSQRGTPVAFTTPAPQPPYGLNLATFKGLNPNGEWKLFIVDDSPGDAGAVTRGWGLELKTLIPSTDLEIRITGIVITPSGGIRLMLEGTANRRFAIQATSGFEAWTELARGVLVGTTGQFEDTGLGVLGTRYYRAVLTVDGE